MLCTKKGKFEGSRTGQSPLLDYLMTNVEKSLNEDVLHDLQRNFPSISINPLYSVSAPEDQLTRQVPLLLPSLESTKDPLNSNTVTLSPGQSMVEEVGFIKPPPQP